MCRSISKAALPCVLLARRNYICKIKRSIAHKILTNNNNNYITSHRNSKTTRKAEEQWTILRSTITPLTIQEYMYIYVLYCVV